MNIVRSLFTTKYIFFCMCLIETCNRDFSERKLRLLRHQSDGAIGDLTTALVSNGAITLCAAVVVSLLCFRLIKRFWFYSHQ